MGGEAHTQTMSKEYVWGSSNFHKPASQRVFFHMPKPEANAVLIAHLSAIVAAMKETGSVTRAWDAMPATLTTAIQKATFTARAPAMVAVHAYMVE